MATIRASLALSFAERYSALIIQLAASLILARLLTPEEIGVYSVGVAVVGLAHTLRDFGISNYLIQESDLTTDRIRAAFTLTLVVAWLLAALVWLSAPFVAEFYHEDGIVSVMHLLSFNFILIPFSSVTVALLRREMCFGSLYRINVLATLCNALTSVTLAIMGVGFISLAWGGVAGAVATFVTATVLRPETATSVPSLREGRRVFSVGSRLSAASVIHELGYVAPALFIGRILGPGPVAYFSRANGLVSMFDTTVMAGIRAVVLPYFSEEHRVGGRLSSVFLLAASYVVSVAWPLLAFTSLLSYPIIRVLYGDQWDSAVPVAQVLCVAFAFSAVISMAYSLILAMGGVHTLMVAQITREGVKILLILVGTMFSLQAVAWGLLLAEAFAMFMFLALVGKRTGIRFVEMRRPFYDGIALTAVSTAFPAWVVIAMPPESGSLVFPLVLSALGATAAWLSGVYLLKLPIRTEITGLIQQLLRVLRSVD